jgi:similar to stage IV sporulation protein
MVKKSFGEYVRGYIHVRAESLNPEKLINMITEHGIGLNNIERKNYTTIEFKMKQNQYKSLKKILRNTNSKTKILKKYGLNFTYNTINRRKFFLLGSIVFISLIILMSSFIWNIQITGNKKISTSIIYNTLKNSGLKVGMVKYNINLRRIEENVIRNLNEISVIKIDFVGTKVEVKIVERTMPPEVINKDTPINIIASKAGIITKILSYKGQPVVKVGDYVKPNQILIMGKITNTENLLSDPTHAMGIVKARTWYENIKEVNYNYKYEIRSGRFKEKIFYVINNKKICLKNSKINFSKYDKIENKTDVFIRGFRLPIEKICEYYYEKVDVFKKLNYSEAVNIGLENAESQLRGILPLNAKLLDKRIFKVSNTKNVNVRVLYIMEENIGIEKEIK